MEVKKPYVFQKTRFQFELKINENIVCQRYIHIEDFNKNSIYSYDFYMTIKEICNLIDEDLKSKSRMFCEIKCQNGYKNEEFTPKQTDGTVNYPLTFTFYLDGRPVMSRMWNGDVYPAAIRNSIDLTNKKKYVGVDELTLYPDNRIVKKVYEVERENLLPKITNILAYDCSYERYDNVFQTKGNYLCDFKLTKN